MGGEDASMTRLGLLAWLVCVSLLGPSRCIRAPGEVLFGYDTVVKPAKLFMNRGIFDRDCTAGNITWREQSDSYKSLVALANNQLDITPANSVDIARAITRQLPVKLV